MTGKLSTLVLCLAALGCAQTPDQPAAKVEVSAAANPNLPPNTPAWKQGLADPTQQTALAPHPGKLTVTPAADIPLNQILSNPFDPSVPLAE